MKKLTKIHWRIQYLACLSGLGISSCLLALFLLVDGQRYLAAGPLNTGHETLACSACHIAAEGSLRQQAQSISHSILSQQAFTTTLGYETVESEVCLSCHERPNDRHPIYRFVEPRFENARAAIQPQFCKSCHAEHSGVRVSIAQGFCSNCHEATELANDPLDMSHAELFANQRWETCLGCHDFHGNHRMDTPTRIVDAYSADTIQAYFDGMIQLYSEELYFPAQGEANSHD